MGKSADQLILEYLAVVADIAHRQLGSRERVDFMTRLRERIEEHRRGSADPAQVRRVLARFGDPERLVRRERRRLDGVAAGSTPPGSGGRSPRSVRNGGRTTRTFAWNPASAAQMRRAARARRAARRVESAGQSPKVHGGWRSQARDRALEVGALGLLGLGGLLLPVPLWLFGAVLAVCSREWAARDKFLGLAGPLVVTGIGVLWYGVRHTGPGLAVDAIFTGGPMTLRFAGPAGAVLLGVRLLRRRRD